MYANMNVTWSVIFFSPIQLFLSWKCFSNWCLVSTFTSQLHFRVNGIIFFTLEKFTCLCSTRIFSLNSELKKMFTNCVTQRKGRPSVKAKGFLSIDYQSDCKPSVDDIEVNLIISYIEKWYHLKIEFDLHGLECEFIQAHVIDWLKTEGNKNN